MVANAVVARVAEVRVVAGEVAAVGVAGGVDGGSGTGSATPRREEGAERRA